MEDLRTRLTFPNTAIKLQGLSRLLANVEKKHAGDFPLSSKTPQSAELALLWEILSWEDSVISAAAGQALCCLVQESRAEFNYILRSFLNLVPTAKNLTGVIGGIQRLLLLQMDLIIADQGFYTCPYSIRDSPHPFITVITNRPDSWGILLDRVFDLLGYSDVDASIQLLDPFVRFCLLEPQHGPKFLPCRMALTSLLTEAIDNALSSRMRLMQWAVDLLPYFQVESSQQGAEVQRFLSSLCGVCTRVTMPASPEWSELLRRVTLNAMTFASSAVAKGHDVNTLLLRLRALAKKQPQVFATEDVWLELSLMLSMAPVTDAIALLSIAHEILKHPSLQRSVTAVRMVAFPLLQLVSLPSSPDHFAQPLTHVQNLASQLIGHLEGFTNNTTSQNGHLKDLSFSFDHVMPESYTPRAIGLLAYRLDLDPQAACKWLRGCRPVRSDVPFLVVCLMSSLLLSKDKVVASEARQVLVAVAEKKPELSPSLLTLFLYKLNCEWDPVSKMELLHAIPSLVSHKMAIAPALHFLRVLSASPELKSTAISLVTSLWKTQDRIFPHLQELLMQKEALPTERLSYELLLAKAASIREICQMRPHQHGKDLLPLLSSLLSECLSNDRAPVAVIVLQGLRFLCDAEVIDLSTTWKVISPKLKCDERPLVLAEVCHFLSLAPALEEDSAKYTSFLGEAVDLLWQMTGHTNSVISGAAFRALAKFSLDHFTILHLPPQVTAEVKEAALKAAISQGIDPQEAPLPAITGKCLVDMLHVLPSEIRADFELLLQSLVAEEVSNLPRGIYHSSCRKHIGNSSHSKAISSLPELLLKLYHGNKQPVLKSAMALSLLFGFDPAVPTGRDGKSRKPHLIQHGKEYHRMFYSLLNEVSVPCTECHQSLMLSSGWGAFMERCFTAYTQMRKAECDLALEKAEAADPEENRLMHRTAWLWARDKLTDLIKSAAKGNPQSQANSIHALAALASAACNYANGLDAEDSMITSKVTEHQGQSHWLTLVTNTILTTLDVRYEATTRIFNLCHLRGSQPSHVVRGSACLALSHLTPHLVTTNTDLIYQALESLVLGLPGVSSEEVPLLHMHHGIGLGLVLARLFEERFVNVAGTESMVSVWKAAYALEEVCLKTKGNRQGSILGLGVCLAAMCTEGRTDTKVHVCGIHQKLIALLEAMDPTDQCYQPLCLCLAVVSGAMYAANILAQEVSDGVVVKLYQDHRQQPKLKGVTLALGTLCHALHCADHPTVGDLTQKLSSSWIGDLESVDNNIKESSISGLLALAGINKTLIPVQMSSSSPDVAHLMEGVKEISRCLTAEGISADLASCTWMLGLCYQASSTLTDSRTAVPLNYHYLPTSSLLRALVDMLLVGAKQAPGPHLEAALRALAEDSTPLPPLSWASLLSPLIRMGLGPEASRLCLKLAAQQSVASPSAALFLVSWLNVALFDSLEVGSQKFLFESLAVLIKVIPASNLQDFLERCLVQPFLDGAAGDVKMSVLRGLAAALKINDPPQKVPLLLYHAVESIYSMTSLQEKDAVMALICQCLEELPRGLLDRITANDFEVRESYNKGMFTRCCLISHGDHPLVLLNRGIEAFMLDPSSSHSECYAMLCSCFRACLQSPFPLHGPMKCLEWLLELMGQLKNIATGIVPLHGLDFPLSMVVSFFLGVFSLAVLCWSSCPTSAFLLSVWPLGEESSEQSLSADQLWSLLPEALFCLLRNEPWKQISPKVMACLVAVHGAPCWETEDHPAKKTLKACQLGLRHLPEFKKASIWSQVLTS